MLSILLLILLATFFYVLHKYLSRNYDYWKNRDVFYFEPSPFVGNFLDIFLFRVTIGEHLANLYRKTDEPFFGMFVLDTPHLILRDPDLIKKVLVKDFNHFENRTVASCDHDPIVTNMLFFNKNAEWKSTRVKMTPVFTSGKLKSMLPAIQNVGVEMVRYLEKQLENREDCFVEAKELSAKYATDVIAKCAFAINAKCFESDNAEFRRMGRLIFDFRWSTAINQTSYFFLPTVVKLFQMQFIDPKAKKFLRDSFWAAIEHRKQYGRVANDLIDSLIEMRNDEETRKILNFEGDAVVAQALQFFLGGFETTSSTIAFALHELCLNTDIQKKLREEIVANLKPDGSFTYENVHNMKYLQSCIDETLRKYPALPFLDRRCTSDYKIPGTEVTIEKGTPIYIPLFGLHYDEKFFPEPEKFDPDRFSEQFGKQFNFLPFGEGPRNCIGERFGLLSTKVALINILKNYKIYQDAKTPTKVEFQAKSFVLASKVGLPMRFSKLN